MTKAQRLQKAAELLRSAGYRIEPPPCVACGGRGYVMTNGDNWIGNAPCPRGCPPPQITLANPPASVPMVPASPPPYLIGGMCSCGLPLGHASTSMCLGNAPRSTSATFDAMTFVVSDQPGVTSRFIATNV